MRPDELDQVWADIDTQRLRTTDLLSDLTRAEWDTPSLCDGWTVRDVSAHLTLQQMTLGSALLAALRHPGSLNHIIHASARDRATRPTNLLIAEIRGMVGSRRHNVGVTPLETLIDIVVHGQDIAVPLGRKLTVPLTAAVTTADRLWWSRTTRIGRLKARVFEDVDLRGLRFVASDADWTAGEGDEVRGPLLSIVLVLTGRPVGADALEGPGASRLGRGVGVANGRGAASAAPRDSPTQKPAG